MWEAIDRCPKAVVARVNGHALAGGSGLVAVCDVGDRRRGRNIWVHRGPAGPRPGDDLALRPAPGRPRSCAGALRQRPPLRRCRGPAPWPGARGGGRRSAGRGRRRSWSISCCACSPVAIAESKRLVRDATAALALEDLPHRLAAVRAAPRPRRGWRRSSTSRAGMGRQIRRLPDRKPRRDRRAGDPRLPGAGIAAIAVHDPGERGRPAPGAGGRSAACPLLPGRRVAAGGGGESPEPTPSTPATATSPRAPSSPRRWSTPDWCGWARRRRSCARLATSCRRGGWRRRPACRSCPATVGSTWPTRR